MRIGSSLCTLAFPGHVPANATLQTDSDFKLCIGMTVHLSDLPQFVYAGHRRVTVTSAFPVNFQQHSIQVASDRHIVLHRGFMTRLIVVPSDLLAVVGRRHAARCPPQHSRVCSSCCGAQVACDLQLVSVKSPHGQL
jgi:hypothetical protein